MGEILLLSMLLEQSYGRSMLHFRDQGSEARDMETAIQPMLTASLMPLESAISNAANDKQVTTCFGRSSSKHALEITAHRHVQSVG